MAEPTFAERFAYLRFLYHLETGDAPGNAEIGRAIGRSGPSVFAWMSRDLPPPDYADGKPLHEPLIAFFVGAGVKTSKAWLIANEGEPPRAALWRDWIEKRRQGARKVAEPTVPMDYGKEITRRPAAGKKRKRRR